MGEFPSGQRGQTVNLLAMPSVVRIHLPPPEKGLASASPFSMMCSAFADREAHFVCDACFASDVCFTKVECITSLFGMAIKHHCAVRHNITCRNAIDFTCSESLNPSEKIQFHLSYIPLDKIQFLSRKWQDFCFVFLVLQFSVFIFHSQ